MWAAPATSRRDDDQRADRAAARDQHALAQQRAGAPHCMQRHRQGLCHRAFAIAHRVRQLVRLVRLDHDLLAERALHMRRAHRAAVVVHVQAVVLQTLLAEGAVAARPARADRHALADGEAAHVVADGLDDAGHLVAQHHRLLDAHGAEAAVLVVVQVGPADAAATHAHLQLIGAERCGLIGLDAQVARGVNDECFHGVCFRIFQSCAVTPPSTYRMWPLTKLEAALDRNTAAPTRSSTLPQRRDGVRPISQLENASFSTSAWFSSVLK